MKSARRLVRWSLCVVLVASCQSDTTEEPGSPGGAQDATAPVVVITSPATIDQELYTLTGTCVDDVGVTELAVTLDGGAPEAIDPVRSPFLRDLTLGEGTHRITVTARDAAGNEASAVIDVTRTPDVPPGPSGAPTSHDLIQDALGRGEIDTETALVYTTWAAFLDDRLPAEYRSTSDEEMLSNVLDRVQIEWAGLSAATREQLEPFRAPPYYEGSWWSLRHGAAASPKPSLRGAPKGSPCHPLAGGCPILEDWLFVGGPNVKVWIQKRYEASDVALAQVVLETIEAKTWPTLTSIMGRTPLPDDGTHVSGGDARLDIALVDLGVLGFTETHNPFSCDNSSVYILLDRTPHVLNRMT